MGWPVEEEEELDGGNDGEVITVVGVTFNLIFGDWSQIGGNEWKMQCVITNVGEGEGVGAEEYGRNIQQNSFQVVNEKVIVDTQLRMGLTND